MLLLGIREMAKILFCTALLSLYTFSAAAEQIVYFLPESDNVDKHISLESRSNSDLSNDEASSAAPITLDSTQQRIVNDLSWPAKMMFYKTQLSNSSAPTNELFLRSRGESEEFEMRSKKDGIDMSTDDTQMKLKLFTLMDGAVRECDLKVRRADMIKAYYKNNTAFGVGYLMGTISDKFRHMTDMTNTLRKMYHQWKPIEHINAYEQVANQAIEITRLIDTAKQEIAKLEASNSTAKPERRRKQKFFRSMNKKPPAHATPSPPSPSSAST